MAVRIIGGGCNRGVDSLPVARGAIGGRQSKQRGKDGIIRIDGGEKVENVDMAAKPGKEMRLVELIKKVQETCINGTRCWRVSWKASQSELGTRRRGFG